MLTHAVASCGAAGQGSLPRRQSQPQPQPHARAAALVAAAPSCRRLRLRPRRRPGAADAARASPAPGPSPAAAAQQSAPRPSAAASFANDAGAAGNPPAAAAAANHPPTPAAVTTGLLPPMSADEARAAFGRLQNGSDVRGVALQLAPDGPPVNLTPAVAFYLGRAFARALAAGDFGGAAGSAPGGAAGRRPRVSVGTDPRLSAGLLKAAMAAGLMDGGADVEDCGLATTPAMYYALRLPSDADVRDASSDGDAAAEAAASAPASDLLRAAGRPLGSVMITASHMPSINNGFKFFAMPQGGLEKPQIGALLRAAGEEAADALAGAPLGDPAADFGAVLERAMALLPLLAPDNPLSSASASSPSSPATLVRRPLLEQYAAHLRRVIVRGAAAGPQPLAGMRIAVDAGNGSGGFFAARVLAPLGADTTGSEFLDPDGRFPNHPPNPEDPRAMAAAVAACAAAGANLGIVFDTDVDRAAIVDGAGSAVNSNRFIALMSAVALRERPGTTIVTDSVTSDGLSEFIARRGGKHLRYQRGYRNVIGKGVALNAAGVDCALMMETSGHGALADNHFLDDGAHLAVKALIEAVRMRRGNGIEGGGGGGGGGIEGGGGGKGGGGLEALVADLREAREAGEFRLKIRVPEAAAGGEDFKAFGARVLKAFHGWVAPAAAEEGGAAPTAAATAAAAAPPPADWSVEPENFEGWRVRVGGGGADAGAPARGWLLLRASLHDPLLVLNVESDDEGGVAAAASSVRAWLGAQGFAGGAEAASSGPQLDLSALP